jgi:hypothetical protein
MSFKKSPPICGLPGKRLFMIMITTRLQHIIYPNFTENNVTYTYGAPGAADNRANRVVMISDESGTSESFYGRLGEVVKTINTINSETGSPEVYTTEYQYDTWNRLQRLIYPDGEVLTHHYDSGGSLRAITGHKSGNDYAYLNRLEYDKFGQRVFVEFGNQVRTHYTYDPLNRRLANLTAKGKGRTFQNLVYEYDNVGNILGQANLAKVTSPNQLGGERTSNTSMTISIGWSMPKAPLTLNPINAIVIAWI